MRYSRQELLIGKKSQKKLSKAKVCIVGIGALGTVTSELLTRAGIGELVLIDRDFVELHNLQRQSLYDQSDIGKPKAMQAKKKLVKINDEIKIKCHVTDLDYSNINLLNSDLIIGCTDNLESRFLIDEYCTKNNIPWIYGAAIGSKGFIMNIIPNHIPFKSIFREATNLGTCDTVGIINTNSFLIGTLIANETIKIIIGKEYEKNLLYVDLWKNEFKKIKINKNTKYVENFEYLSGKKQIKIAKLCGTGVFQFKEKKIDFNKLKFNLSKNYEIKDSGYCFHHKEFTVFKDGRIFVKAKDKIDAKKKYNKFIGS
jgi:molybdopterin-synthase adenylyltransferase